MSKFKVGDKVKVTKTMLAAYRNCPFSVGDTGKVKIIDEYDCIGVEFDKRDSLMNDLDGWCANFHGWWCSENDIELAVPTLAEIKKNHLDCLIHTKTQEEANTLCHVLADYDTMREWWSIKQEKTVYRITDGQIASYSDINYYPKSQYKELPMYEFEDIPYEFVKPKMNFDAIEGIIVGSAITERIAEMIPTMGCRTSMASKDEIKNIKNKENDNMNKDSINFIFTKGERTAIVVDTIEHKDSKGKTILEKKTRKVKIPTIKTTAYTINGTKSTTCDEEDFNERTGCLVASAKVIANKSEEANLMYQIAIKTWGTDTSTIILETLADRAVAGDFNKRYNKWKKVKTAYDKEQRTCKVCGKLYESIEEARKCEQAHAQRKADKRNNYLERKEAMRIARERLEKEYKEQLVEECVQKIINENHDNGDTSWF